MFDEAYPSVSTLTKVLESDQYSQEYITQVFNRYAESVFTEKESSFHGVLPAAGHGRRLQDVTNGSPKELVNVGPQKVIEYSIDVFEQCNNSVNLSVVLRPEKTELFNYLKQNTGYDSNLSYGIIHDTQGMAQSILAAPIPDTEPVIVVVPDSYYEKRGFLDELIEAHKKNSASATLGCTRPSDRYYGALTVENPEQNAGVVEYVPEDPSEANSNLVVAGAMIFDPIVFKYIKSIIRADNQRAGEYRLSTVINHLNTVAYFCIDCGTWIDTGTPERLELARKNATK